MTSSGLQFEVAFWPAMTLGGAAQVAAAHCPNERTLDPSVCSYNRPTCAPASRTTAFTPLFLVASITRYWLLLIYQPRRDVRLSWPEHHEESGVKGELGEGRGGPKYFTGTTPPVSAAVDDFVLTADWWQTGSFIETYELRWSPVKRWFKTSVLSNHTSRGQGRPMDYNTLISSMYRRTVTKKWFTPR